MEYIKKNLGLIIVITLSILPLINLVTPGLPVTHDNYDHVARIASFYQNLSDGNLIPRWAGNLNWGYGHPILMFLYPLPSYFASIFHFLDISLINSLKLVFVFSYILSGISMYVFLKNFLRNNAAIAGAVLYLYAPYRFVDIYVRGAIGEQSAFIFIPLVLLSLLKLGKLNIKTRLLNFYLIIIFISFSFAGLILSHNAISLIFIPFIIFYIFYLYFENKSKAKLFLSFISLFIGFLLSFFFWFPALIEGKYTLRNIVIQDSYQNRFVQIKDLLFGIWNYGGDGEFTIQLGIIQILIVIAALIFLFKFIKSKDNHKYLLIGTLVFLFISIFLMLNESNFIWSNVSILQKLQFPWRLLTITAFFTALIGAILIDKINLKNKNIICLLIIIAAILPTINYWNAKEYKTYNEDYFKKSFPSTTDTGESAPIWSIRFMEEYPKAEIEILEGKAEIVNLSRNSTYHEYIIDAKEKTRIRENTLYFPGWKVYDNYNLINNIEFQDPKNRGVITFYLDQGLHNIILKFENTKLRQFSNYISFISLFLILLIPCIFLLFPNLKIKKYKW